MLNSDSNLNQSSISNFDFWNLIINEVAKNDEVALQFYNDFIKALARVFINVYKISDEE